jgi:hypothetical protein
MTDQLAIALKAIERYAARHPRPAHVTQKQAAELLGKPEEEIRDLIRDGAFVSYDDEVKEEDIEIPIEMLRGIVHGDQLHELLRKIVGDDQGKIMKACQQIKEAARDYLSSKPMLDADGRRKRFTVANEREALTDLHETLSAARDAAKSLPLDASATFADEYKTPIYVEIKDPSEENLSKHIQSFQVLGASLGKLSQDLDKMVVAAERALVIAKARLDKEPDHDRNILAQQVGVVVRDVLKIPLVSTRDDKLKVPSKPHSAAYAKVLRLTFEMVGIKAREAGEGMDEKVLDIGRDIDRGIESLQDKSNPFNLPKRKKSVI